MVQSSKKLRFFFKSVLITGGTSGIDAAVAKAFTRKVVAEQVLMLADKSTAPSAGANLIVA